ncbi:MAG: hypothetical protein HZC28_05855 [Spirochaetes bacterium]|nr:hypothetical protein [Spirochaetota bacterium]
MRNNKIIFLFIVIMLFFSSCDKRLNKLSETIHTPAGKLITYTSNNIRCTECFFDDNVYVLFQKDDRTVGKWRLIQDGSIFLHDLNKCGLAGVGKSLQSTSGNWILYSDYEFAVSPVSDYFWKNGKAWSNFAQPFLSGRQLIDSNRLDFIDFDEYHTKAYKSIEKSEYINRQIESLKSEFIDETKKHEKLLHDTGND